MMLSSLFGRLLCRRIATRSRRFRESDLRFVGAPSSLRANVDPWPHFTAGKRFSTHYGFFGQGNSSFMAWQAKILVTCFSFFFQRFGANKLGFLPIWGWNLPGDCVTIHYTAYPRPKRRPPLAACPRRHATLFGGGCGAQRTTTPAGRPPQKKQKAN